MSSRQAILLERHRYRSRLKRARLWIFTAVACTAILLFGPEVVRDDARSNLGPATTETSRP